MGAGVTVMAMVVGVFTAKPLVAQIKAAFVKDVDQPARNYITFEFYPTYAPSYTVPAGKVLVIEQVSSSGISSNTLLALSFDGDLGAPSNNHRWSMYFAPPQGGFLVNQQVRIYAKSGQTITYSYGPGSAGQLFAQGYLVDAD
jgi:hypothetical protein